MSPASLKPLSLALVAAVLPAMASAELTANISLTSNYKFRGQDQDTHRIKAVSPAIQGGFDYAFEGSGFYLGNWNSSVDWLAGNSIESDLYGGYKLKAGALDLDLGALAYVYPGNSSGNTVELYGAAGWGPFTAKYSHTVSKDYFGWAGAKTSSNRGRNTGYLNLAFAQEVAPSTTLKASVGFTRFGGDITAPNFMDYSLGGSYDFGGGVSLGAAVVGATKKAFYGPVNKSRVIVTLTKTL